ncbi:hypothetical protein EIP91_008211 [Steccherinum ochraceum]|uniref:Uncharacterized protein n=1 Tax=Steccherinum ochraceum TaxID=92696 RepID=A0A4R0RNM7_9APHY|nr:hypothetical protein EIP91_008211 [Steccherinum ochraceum]
MRFTLPAVLAALAATAALAAPHNLEQDVSAGPQMYRRGYDDAAAIYARGVDDDLQARSDSYVPVRNTRRRMGPHRLNY